MNLTRVLPSLIAAVFMLAVPCWATAPAEYGEVELLRDAWGTAHVFSSTDAGAMYGLGYACAEDRGFQMYYSLRIIQGRLAEVVGDVARVGKGQPGTAAEGLEVLQRHVQSEAEVCRVAGRTATLSGLVQSLQRRAVLLEQLPCGFQVSGSSV